MSESLEKGEMQYNSQDIANPGKVDEALWEKAKKISMESYGEIRRPFVTYMYKELGGKFE